MNTFSDIPTLDLTSVPLMDGADMDVLAIEAQLSELPHLDGDRAHDAPETDRDYRNAIGAKTAAEAIGALPGPRAALHLAISGRFALWDCVPAALQLATPATIARLYIATLGFSKNNVMSMCELIDAGTVGSITLIASHYFKGTSSSIYQFGLEELTRRSQRFLSIRSHAKLLAMQFNDGRTLTVESSANLRSNKNIEQMTLIGDPGLFDFHAGWIEELFK